jgi:hypothetical protein
MQSIRKLILWFLVTLGFLAPVYGQSSIRGSAAQSSSSTNFTIDWPLGTVSGDLVVIVGTVAYNATVPSGWTNNLNVMGSEWNGLVYSKVLNSTDISNGSVTIDTAGTFDGAFAIVTFIGNPGTIREVDNVYVQVTNPTSVSTSGALTNTDLALFFGSMRNSGSPRTITTSIGSSLQFTDDSANAFARLSVLGSMYGGEITQSWAFGTIGSYNTDTIVIVEGAGTPYSARHKIIDD